jgi:hypothetical protein
VVTRQIGRRKAAYVNTCCHTCLSLAVPRSPLRASPSAAFALRNVIRWLLVES